MGWVGGIAPMRPLRESETRWACMFSLRDLGFGQINGSVHISKYLPLEAEEREEQLHREVYTFDEWWVTETKGLTRPTCLEMR